MGQLEAADLLGDGAGEGALLVAEQLALQQPGGDGRAVELDEGLPPAGTEVVQSACDEFLARARLAKNEDGGSGAGDGVDLLQDPAERGAVADDLPEVVRGADLLLRGDLLLQVDLLLGQLVLEGLDLIEGQAVLYDHGHLVGDLLQEVHIRRVVGAGLLTP